MRTYFLSSPSAAFGALLAATNIAAAEPRESRQPAASSPYGTLSPATVFNGMAQCFTAQDTGVQAIEAPGKTLAVSGGPAVLQACEAAIETAVNFKVSGSSTTGQKAKAGATRSAGYSVPFFEKISYAPNDRLTLSLTKELGFGATENWAAGKAGSRQSTGSSELDLGAVALLARQGPINVFATTTLSSEAFSKSPSAAAPKSRDSRETIFDAMLGGTYDVNSTLIVGTFAGLTDTKDTLATTGKPDSLQNTLGIKLEVIAQKRLTVDLPWIGERPFFVSATIDMVEPVKRSGDGATARQPAFSESLGITVPMLLRPDLKVFAGAGVELDQNPESYMPTRGPTRPAMDKAVKARLQVFFNTK